MVVGTVAVMVVVMAAAMAAAMAMVVATVVQATPATLTVTAVVMGWTLIMPARLFATMAQAATTSAVIAIVIAAMAPRLLALPIPKIRAVSLKPLQFRRLPQATTIRRG